MVVRHNPRCPLCGAPTRAHPFRERTAWVCTDCGSLTVEAATAAELLVSAETPGNPVRRARRPERRRSGNAAMALGFAAAVALVLLAVPVSLLVYQLARDRAALRRAVPVVPEVALATSLGEPAPPVVLPEAPPPEPEPFPEPDPAPSAAPAPSASSLTASGWVVVDRDPRAAVALFEAATTEHPGDPDAAYGLGYAKLQLGDRDGARRWLCEARSAGSSELRREVQSLLDHHRLTCSP